MKKFQLMVLSVVLWGASSLVGADPVKVDIDRYTEKFNLGLSKFYADSRKTPKAAPATVSKVIHNDLDFTRLFRLIKDGPVVKKKTDTGQWQKLGAQWVLTGKVRQKSPTKVEVTAELYDTKSARVDFKTKKKSNTGDIQLVAHEVANEIMAYFTGKAGIFTSKIAYVNDATGRKELYLAHYDGQQAKRLTNDNSIVILPRISPDGSKIVFTSYISGNPDLYLFDVENRTRKKLSAKAGLNVSPSWAPSNDKLAVTLSKDGPPNVYLMDLSGKVIRRLTDGKGADTAPSFSPDGTQIAFTSDRAGAPHIYVIGIDGSGLRRLTTEGHCDSAAWSPDGKTIVYVKGKSGSKFDIYSIEVLTGIERRLTWAEGDNENPVWSPDSRAIIFTSNRNGKTELFTMSADGSNQRPLIKIKGQSFTPHWSS